MEELECGFLTGKRIILSFSTLQFRTHKSKSKNINFKTNFLWTFTTRRENMQDHHHHHHPDHYKHHHYIIIIIIIIPAVISLLMLKGA